MSIEQAQAMEYDAEKASLGSSDAPSQHIDPWHDPTNKRNPANWALPLKIYHSALPCFLSFTITFATATTVPATGILAHKYNIDRTTSILPLTLYTIGLAFGPMLTAPLSESFGRKPVYLVSHLLFCVFMTGAGFSNTFASLLILRFLAGFLGSAGVAMGAGTVQEIWGRHPAGGMVALMFILGPFLGPTLGPLSGAYLLKGHGNDWRWTQWILPILGLPILVGLGLMRETHRATIERTTRPTSAEITSLLKRALVKPAKMLTTDLTIFSLALYTAYAYAMIFSFFASSAYVLPLYYGFNLQQVGLASLAVVIGYILACIAFGAFDRTLYARALRISAPEMPAPEHRLYSALCGSIMIPVGLFWYAWEAKRGGHWASLVAAGIPFGFGAFSLFLSAITYMVEIHGPGGAASALAANGALRYTLGATFPLFTFQMYERLGPHWAGSIFGFLSLGLLPIPWLLFKYGPKLRAHKSG